MGRIREVLGDSCPRSSLPMSPAPNAFISLSTIFLCSYKGLLVFTFPRAP